VQELAQRQSGLVTAKQAAERGVSARVQKRLVESGTWTRHLGCLVVSASTGTPPTRLDNDRRDATAIGLRLGPDAIVSGPTALRLQQWHVSAADLIVSTNPLHNYNRIPGLRILRDGVERRTIAGVTCRIARRDFALVDTLLHISLDDAFELFDQAMQRHWVTSQTWGLALELRAGKGRNGVTRLRQLERRLAEGSHSEGERVMRRLLTHAGLRGWKSNYALRSREGRILAELDFALPRLRLCIEIDGRAAHSGREQFELDRRRQNLIQLHGWMVLRFTWWQLINEPETVVAHVRAAIALRERDVAVA